MNLLNLAKLELSARARYDLVFLRKLSFKSSHKFDLWPRQVFIELRFVNPADSVSHDLS